jgi:hypothetical protein
MGTNVSEQTPNREGKTVRNKEREFCERGYEVMNGHQIPEMDIFRSVISNLKMEGGSSSETLVL